MKRDLALNNLQRLICHKTQTANQRIGIQLKKFCSGYMNLSDQAGSGRSKSIDSDVVLKDVEANPSS